MSKTVTALAAFIAVVMSSSLVLAAEKSRKKYAKPDPKPAERIYSQPDGNGWYPHDSRQLKFGSKIWWEQMEREGRLGRRDW